MAFITVTTTTGNRDEARSIAAHLVDAGLVACAQISEIESVYRWKGAMQQEPEWRLLVKTEARLYPAVEQAILQRHSYDLPAVHSIPIDQIHAAYGHWLASCLVDQVPEG